MYLDTKVSFQDSSQSPVEMFAVHVIVNAASSVAFVVVFEVKRDKVYRFDASENSPVVPTRKV